MSEKESKKLALDELKNVSGGYTFEVVSRAGAARVPQTIEYIPNMDERIFGGVSLESVAAYGAMCFKREEKEFLNAMKAYLRDKLNKDPRYFQGSQIIDYAEVAKNLK